MPSPVDSLAFIILSCHLELCLSPGGWSGVIWVSGRSDAQDTVASGKDALCGYRCVYGGRGTNGGAQQVGKLPGSLLCVDTYT